MTRILVTCAQMKESLPELQEEIDQFGWEIEAPELTGQQFTEEELIDLLPGIKGVIAGDDPFSARVIESADKLRAISKWGIGVDGIDMQAAKARRIVVTRTPDMFGDEVADVAIGYLICLARGLVEIHNSVVQGGWHKPNGYSLRGKKAGIIGLGDIGCAIAVRAKSLGMEVRATDPDEGAQARAGELGISLVSDVQALDGVNALFTACPLTPATRGIVSESVLESLGTPAWLIHVSRGPVVDTTAVTEALAAGTLDGAALDVFPHEPLPLEDALRRVPGVLFGSHNGSHTREATLRTSKRALINLVEVLR
jgi:D-3-phosphoglycerate dehydrogenase / 2-oxoglutarate reductase